MNDRIIAMRIGWLFVVASAAGVASVLFLGSILSNNNLMMAVAGNQNRFLIGNMMILLMLAAMAGTAVLLYPVLKRYNPIHAYSYVMVRTLEIVILLIGVVGTLLLIPLGWDFVATGADTASLTAVGDTLGRTGEWTGYLGAQIIFSLSALVLNFAFYRNKLIPKWLAIWGLIGVPLMFASGFLVMVESLHEYSAEINILVIPLALQEMVMAVWLIVKGFNSKSVTK